MIIFHPSDMAAAKGCKVFPRIKELRAYVVCMGAPTGAGQGSRGPTRAEDVQ